MNSGEYINHAKLSFDLAQDCRSKLDFDELVETGIQGQSGVKNLCLMNNLCSINDLNYLEIGLFNGLTFYCSLYKNSVNAVGIDNWSEFNGSRDIFDNNMSKCQTHSEANIVYSDCFSKFSIESCKKILDKKKIDIFLYDGGHSEKDHNSILRHYDADILSDTFIFVVDDWQQLEVQRGTILALDDAYDVLWEATGRSVNDDIDNWWCGTYISVLKKRV